MSPPPPPAFRGRRDNRSRGNGGGRASPAPPPGRGARQAAAARPRSSPRLPARPPPGVSGAPAAVRARAARGRDYAKMVLQARNKHREAAPKSPRRGTPDAGEPGPERASPSPGRKGAAGRKGPRAEPAAPPSGGGLGGRLAAGLRGALGLRRAGRGRTWTTLLLGEQPPRGAAGRGTSSRRVPSSAAPLPLPAAPPRPRARQLAARSAPTFPGTAASPPPPPSPRLRPPGSLPTRSRSLLLKTWPRDQQLRVPAAHWPGCAPGPGAADWRAPQPRPYLGHCPAGARLWVRSEPWSPKLEHVPCPRKLLNLFHVSLPFPPWPPTPPGALYWRFPSATHFPGRFGCPSLISSLRPGTWEGWCGGLASPPLPSRGQAPKRMMCKVPNNTKWKPSLVWADVSWPLFRDVHSERAS